MTKAVFGLVNTEEQADRIVNHLLSAGFSNEDISILIHDKNNNRVREYAREDIDNQEDLPRNKKNGRVATEKHTKAPEGGVTGAATGGVLGGSLGLLAGIGALAIPGAGPFIAAGPIMAALSGSAIGGSLGLLLGTLIGSGIPEYEAKRYETGVKEGKILLSVHTDSDEDIRQAQDILKKEGAKDISVTSEKAKSRY